MNWLTERNEFHPIFAVILPRQLKKNNNEFGFFFQLFAIIVKLESAKRSPSHDAINKILIQN